MKFILNSALLLALAGKSVDAAGVGTFYTYYELGGLGPANWANLQIDGNQCGGTQGASGFGQSPVTVDFETNSRCHTDMAAYDFDGGDCSWSDLKFSISNNGVKVEPKSAGACNFGKMNIPHTGNKFNALQFHIHTYSEHQIEGQGDNGYFPAELHVVHQEETEESFAVFGTMISVGAMDHPMFEGFLQGWEAVAQGVEDSCSAVTRKVRSLQDTIVQEVVTCPAPGTGAYGPNGASPVYPTDVPPNVYELPTNKEFGTFTYKGGLTTPGCTEIVNWNLLDTPMEISASQLARLEKLILCYVAKEFADDGSTLERCSLATVASESGSTSRPPQPLLGRRVLHRCRTGPSVEIPDIGVLPPPADAEFVKPAPPTEPLNTEEGKCEKGFFQDCSDDKRYNPAASLNLRENNEGWNEVEGLWVGKMLVYDAAGNPLQPTFASTKVQDTLPYTRDEITVFVNRTVSETRYYEHVYYVYPPAPEEFCLLPVPDEASNQVGAGFCGVNGFVEGASKYATATHEKDGVAEIFMGNGRFAGGTGETSPVGAKSMYASLVGEGFKVSETYTFTNDAKTRMSGSGQFFIISDSLPYSENPLAKSFSVNLHQVDHEGFILALDDAYDETQVPDVERIRASVDGDCFLEDCPTPKKWNRFDPLATDSPYSEDTGVKGGFIALFVILGFIFVFGGLYFVHKSQLDDQSDRYRKQFATAVADTIHLEGTTPEELEAEFKKIDSDNNGYLTKKELRTFMSGMDQRDFDAMFAAIDLDGSGTVEFTEFCAFITLLPTKASSGKAVVDC